MAKIKRKNVSLLLDWYSSPPGSPHPTHITHHSHHLHSHYHSLSLSLQTDSLLLLVFWFSLDYAFDGTGLVLGLLCIGFLCFGFFSVVLFLWLDCADVPPAFQCPLNILQCMSYGRIVTKYNCTKQSTNQSSTDYKNLTSQIAFPIKFPITMQLLGSVPIRRNPNQP